MEKVNYLEISLNNYVNDVIKILQNKTSHTQTFLHLLPLIVATYPTHIRPNSTFRTGGRLVRVIIDFERA